jgi:Zn finger protein HypA/HybF involved in hydrogenase expression
MKGTITTVSTIEVDDKDHLYCGACEYDQDETGKCSLFGHSRSSELGKYIRCPKCRQLAVITQKR